MKKIYKKLRPLGMALFFSTVVTSLSFGQFGCGSAVVIADGYTQAGITTPGTGGAEDWNDNPTGTSINSSYWDDDVYLFEYTAGANTETISMTINTNNSWNGIGIFDDCTGLAFSNELDASSSGSGTGTQTVSATIASGNTVYIAVGQWGTPNDLDFDVTDFSVSIITCPDPTALASSNTTSTSTDIDWTENGSASLWNVEVGAPGFTPGSGNELFADNGNTTQTSNFNSLTPNTTYEVYVQADCGGGDFSDWTGPISVTTLPTPQTPVSSFPWDEDFETGGTEWTYLNGSGITNTWNVGSAVSNGGSNSLYISNDNGVSHTYTNNSYSVVSAYRDISIPATAVSIELSFDFLGLAESCCDYVRVWAVPTSYEPAAGTTFGDMVTSTGSAPTGRVQLGGNFNGEASFVNETLTIPAAYAGETFRLVFQWKNDGSVGSNPPAAIDNVNISIFSCLSPSGLVASNIDTDEATVSWDDNTSGAPSFEVEYGPAGFTPGTGTTVVVTDTFAILTGLTPDQDYEYYVSAECGDGTFSAQSGVDAFTTLIACDQVTNVTIIETTTNSVELTWNAPVGYSDFVIEYGPAGFTPGSGTTVAAPPTTITGLDDNTEYDFYVSSDCGGGSFSQPVGPITTTTLPTCPAPTDLVFSEIGADSVVVAWTENGSATDWVIEFDTAGFVPGTGTIVNTTDNPDTLLLLNPEWTYDVYVWTDCGAGDLSDTITGSFTTQPTCLPISDLIVSDIGPDTAVVSWTANGTETSWNIEYGPEGFVQGTGTVISGGTNPDTITGLDSGVSYDVYVTADCGAGDVADTVGPVTFTTEGTCGIYELSLEDSFGDGWNGGEVDVYVNGTLFLSGLTIGSGGGPEVFEISMNINDVLSIDYTAGGFSAENSYQVFDEQGNLVATEGANGTPNDLGDFNVPSGIVACPTCPAPSDFVLDTVGLDFADISWTSNGAETSWNIEFDTTGFALGNGNFVDGTTDNPYSINGLQSGATYDVYVQASCSPSDSSGWEGPFTFSTAYTCQDTLYDNGGANGNYASPSDDVYRMFAGAPNQYVRLTFEEFQTENNFDGIYVYDGDDVNDSLLGSLEDGSFGFVTDSGHWSGSTIPGPFYSSNAQGALTVNFGSDGSISNPGFKGYVDCFDCDPTPGVDGSIDFCRLDDTLDLNTLVTLPTHPDASRQGTWMFPANPGVLVQDSLIIATTLAEGTFEAWFILSTPCGADTTVATINIYGPSQAGMNGTLNVCLNEPINLFDGLSGNADLAGDWYDPSNQLLPNSQPTASNIPGSFNYDYVTTNGVCPADTALVEVIVDGDCDWLSIGEEELNEISVYPNPATNVINIVNPANTSALKVEIFDVNGRIVATDDNALENSTEGSIAIDHLETGIYTLRVYGENGHKTFKIVKK